MPNEQPNPAAHLRTEILRAARLCAPNLESVGALTFTGDAADPAQISAWAESVLRPHLVPAADSAWKFGRTGVRELLAADKLLSEKLAGPLARNSRSAGTKTALAAQAPAGETALARYMQSLSRGETDGNFAVVFCARAGVFHIPKNIALAALVFMELRAVPLPQLWDAIDACAAVFPAPDNKGLRAA